MNAEGIDMTELLNQAEILLAEEKTVDAEISLKRILQDNPENPKALNLLCRLALQCNQPEKAAQIFSKYESCAVPDIDVTLLMAEAQSGLGNNTEAGRLIAHALKLAPDNKRTNRLHVEHEYKASNLDVFPHEDFIADKKLQRKPGAIFFHAVNVVWGKEFTSLYVEDVMPTQLGKDNIEALNTEERSLYVIYTTPDDAEYIKQSPAFKRLVETIDVRIYHIDFSCMDPDSKYELMVLAHKHALRKGQEAGARMVFLAPDAVFSDNTFRNMYEKTAQGFKAIMIGTMRVTKEDFKPLMRQDFFQEESIEVPIPARPLVDMAIRTLHPDTRRALIGAEKGNGWPSQLLWEIPGEGILARNYHLHPVMINPVQLNDFHGAVDVDCVRNICDSIEDIYIVQDSDEMIGFDLSSRDARTIRLSEPLRIDYISAWADEHADHLHRQFANHEIRIHNGRMGPEWKQTAEEADSLVRKIKDFKPEAKEHNFPTVLSDYDLRFPPLSLDSVSFQPITKCNLDCVYCPQNWNKGYGSEMDESLLKKTVDYIKDNDVIQATLGFYGETLIGKDWVDYCTQLLDAGVTMNLCSNFNMPLSDEECRVLSRFNHIQLSIDSPAPNILKEVRPPANLERMLLNMHRIRSAAILENRPVPDFQWMCTLTDRVAAQLPELVSLAVSNNVPQLNCNELVYFDDRKLPVESVFTLKGQEFIQAIAHIDKARRLAAENKIRMSMLPAWDRMVKDRLAVDRAEELYGIEVDIAARPVELGKMMQNIQGEGRIYCQQSAIPGPGETRACLFPWNSVYIMPDGSLHSCCIRGKVMADLNKFKSVREAMHTPGYTDLRRQLITGNITDEECLHCPITYVIPVRELKRRVADMIRASMGVHQ